MRENIVVKGGSKCLQDAEVLDYAVLELHAVVQGSAVVKDHARVSRSTVEGQAVIAGEACTLDAYIAGTAHLTSEFIGRNGHVTHPRHYMFLRVLGIGYTVHRTHSDAKGYSAQIMREDGKKLTENALRQLISENEDHKVLLYVLNMHKKTFAAEADETV